MRHHVSALPLPMTHCTVCWRACDAASLDYAELAYEQKRPGSGLRRISGAVFSKLCGHRPPHCCDAAWHATDVLETFVRYDKSREVHEAPFNPGCSPDYSHVGGSLRLLPTARLDRLTSAWQTKYGYDSKPFYEMHQAYVSLKGSVVQTSTKCTMSFCSRISAEAEICDYSRSFSSEQGEVVSIMGRLTLHFHNGAEKSSFSLPSRHLMLAVVPSCRKGSVPLLNGTPAYLKRRYEMRPNTVHIVRNKKEDLECTLLCQNERGERRSFMVEARARAQRERSAETGEDDAKQRELHFFVRVPRAETTQDGEMAKKLKRAAAGKGNSSKESLEMLPLMTWLMWLLRGFDEGVSIEAVQEELTTRLKRALEEELGRAPPESFVEETVAAQSTTWRPYVPKSRNVKTGSFLLHVPDEADCKLEALSQLLAKALAVHLMQRPADALPTIKSMNSPSDIWQGLIREAVRKALSASMKKSLGKSERKVRDGQGVLTTKVVHHEYSGTFETPSDALLRKCCLFEKDERLAPRSSAVVVDAFSEYHAEATGADSFHFLHEKACGWDQNQMECPMCLAEYEPRYDGAAECHICRFKVLPNDRDLDLYRFKPDRKVSQAASSKDVRLQKLYLTLGLAHHVATDGVAGRFLCKALKGKSDDKEKPPVGSIVAAGTENSSKGTNAKRGENLPTELHENLIDGRAGKDNNPDLRVYLLTGSCIQHRPSPDELETLMDCIRAPAPWHRSDGGGRLEVRGRTLWHFDSQDVCAVMQDVRMAVHRSAELRGNGELATCCPVLSYSAAGPVVTLLCSGHELVRAVGWRSLTASETAALEAVEADLPFSQEGLHESWKALGDSGLTWEMLVYSGIVSYCASDRHMVLKEDSIGFSASDGLTFYKISPELESSMRVLQTEDAATWQAGHAIRQGYSVGMALNGHKFEPLAHSRGSISSVRSVGFDPCKGNMRNLVGSAPDNHYGSTLKLMALLHDFGTIMQEDSMPESADAFRHVVFRHHSVFFTARTHWKTSKEFRGHRDELMAHVASNRNKNFREDIGACVEDRSGLVEKPFTFVQCGQALCFVLGGEEPEEKGNAAGHLLRVAHCDMWVKHIRVRASVFFGAPLLACVCLRVCQLLSSQVEPMQEGNEKSYRYEVQYLTMELYNEGQKLGKLYQKFVSVFLEDWISGGRGRVTGLLSSSSISSRTAVQNLMRSWMTSLALASGVGNLDLGQSLSAEASLVRESLQSSRPLSASALSELRRRTPGSSVSNQGPMVSGRQGRYFGSCVQLMTSVLVAVQDASKPNGSVNGVPEVGRAGPGNVRLDPIMSVLYRFLGFEQHEEVQQPGARSACSACGKFGNGQCDCTDERGQPMPKREANVNPAFRSASASLACCNIDVCLDWEKPMAASEPRPVDPESPEWAAVPADRGDISMLDARRRAAVERPSDRVTCSPKMVDGRLRGLVFGRSPVGRILADQFVFAMRALRSRAVWDSGDHTDGYTVVAHGNTACFAEALHLAAEDVARLKRQLQDFKAGGSELPLDSLMDVGGISLGAEVGGTLQLQTSDERTKQVLIGAMSFANAAKRVCRAFLVEAPSLELSPLRNPAYSCKETCNELELRLEFERNVLGYLYLATTLAMLPVRRGFQGDGTVVRAELRLVPECPHVSASHIFGEDGRRLFFKDVVLGANPLHRGWCTTSSLPLKFVVYAARVEHYPTAWQDVPGLCASIEAGAPREEMRRRLDGSLTSSPPAMTGIDQRPVFEAVVRDVEAFRKLDPAVCGYGVLNHGDIKMGSTMYCTDCKDCTRYFDTSVKGALATVMDIEDTAVSASTYFRRIDGGNRRRLYEGGSGWKARRMRAAPLLIVARENLWAFRCCTDEDVGYLTSQLGFPTTLEEAPGVLDLLKGVPARNAVSAAEEDEEKIFLERFWRKHGGPTTWVLQAHAAVQLLLDSAEELETALREARTLL